MEAGNPPEGLIHALSLDGRGGAAAMRWDEVINWETSQSDTWLHLDFEDVGTESWLVEHSGLNDIALNALTTDETRPRTLSRGDNLLLTLRGINMGAADNPEDMISLRLWTDGRRIISTRRRPLVSTSDVLADLEEGNGPVDAPGLLVAWIDRLVWRMNETIESFEDQVLALEDTILSGDTAGARGKLARLRKQTISIRRYLAPQREAMNRLVSESLSWLNDMHRLQLREINDRLIRYIEDIDEVRDRAALAQEELSSRIAEQMNKRSYVFTVVATIFLPLGFFTGLMGINVGGMPGVESDYAFWVVLALCVGLTAVLAVLFRMKKWL